MSQPTTLAGAVQINDFENYFNNFLIHKDQQHAVAEEPSVVSPGDPGAGCLDDLDLPGDLTLPEPASSSLDHANWDVNASTLQTLDIDDVLAVMDGLSLGNDVCKRSNNDDDDDGEKKEVNSQQRQCLGLSSQEKVAECSKKKSPCKKDRHSADVEKVVVGVCPNKHKDTKETPMRGKAGGGTAAEAGSSKSRSLPNLHDNWFSKFCATDALHRRARKHSCNVCEKTYKTMHGLTKHMLKHLPDDAPKEETERVETGSGSVNEGDTSVDDGAQCCSRKQSGKAAKIARDGEMEMEGTDQKHEIVGTGSDGKENVGKSGTQLCATNVSPRKRKLFCL